MEHSLQRGDNNWSFGLDLARKAGYEGEHPDASLLEAIRQYPREWEEFQGLVANAVTQRSQFIQQFSGRHSSIQEECGYPLNVTSLSAEDYKNFYDGFEIATRVVEVMPKQCWKVQPSVFEDESADTETEFELAWKELPRDVKETGWFEDEQGSAIWEYLARADILSGIGHFGIVLLGIDDGRNLDEPIEGITAITPEGHPKTPVGTSDYSDQTGGRSPGPSAFVSGTDAQYDGAKGGSAKANGKGQNGKDDGAGNGQAFSNGKKNGKVSKGLGRQPQQAQAGQGQQERGQQPSGNDSRAIGSDQYIQRSQYNMHSRYISPPVVNRRWKPSGMPDCLIHNNELKALRGLGDYDPKSNPKGLNEQEKALLDRWEQQRNLIVNERRDIFNKYATDQAKVTFNAAMVNNDSQSPYGGMGGLSWAPYGIPYQNDTQYMGGQSIPGAFGGYATVPGQALSGTDQQYYGVQFGPSEKTPTEPSKTKKKLLFLRVYDESLVQVVRYEWNVRNPRFGLPVMYRVTLNDPREHHSGVGLPLATVFVHWSRIIHVVDTHGQAGTSEIFSPPRMRCVYNRLLDLYKLYAGSAEMYWRGAFPGLSLETHPQLGGDVTLPSNLSSYMQKYFTGLQRWLAVAGMSAKTLSPQVVDPSGQIDKALEAICIKLGIPKRIFLGSERGELASSQDDEAFNENILHRQETYITPRLICPFVDRLILIGVLPEPKKYHVIWPDLEAIGADQKARIALTRIQTLVAYMQGNLSQILTPADLFSEFMDLEPEKGLTMLENVSKAQQQEMTSGQGFYADQARQQAQQQAMMQQQGQQFDEDGNPIEPEEGDEENGKGKDQFGKGQFGKAQFGKGQFEKGQNGQPGAPGNGPPGKGGFGKQSMTPTMPPTPPNAKAVGKPGAQAGDEDENEGENADDAGDQGQQDQQDQTSSSKSAKVPQGFIRK